MQQAQDSTAICRRNAKDTPLPPREEVTHVFISKQRKRLYVYSAITQIGQALEESYSATRAETIIPGQK